MDLPEPTGLPVSQALDNPGWAALNGPQQHLAVRYGRAARYPADMSPFMALADDRDDAAWADLATLVGPGGIAVLMDLQRPLPAGWAPVSRTDGVQLVADTFVTEPCAQAQRLGPDDVSDMLDLVARTQPGPFLPRTVEFGTYLGIRIDGELVAMAGERTHLPGWTEISAVCTATAFRGQGFATALVRAVGAGIRERGETPMMHAAANNTSAIGLYLDLGFRLRRHVSFQAVQAPDHTAGG